MKIFLFLITCLSSIACGNVACKPRTIESISYHSQGGKTLVLINLSDNSVWKWSPDFYSENMLRKWQTGDEILIHANYKPGFILKNLQNSYYSPQVCLTFNSYLLYPFIESIKGKTIYLSDGSIWEYIFEFNRRTLRYWQIGDRIIPVLGEVENFQLINMDVPFDNRSQIERYIEVFPKSEECQVFDKSSS